MSTVFPASPSNGDTYIPPQIQKLLASDRDSSEGFGGSVFISTNGNIAFVGATVEDTSPNTDNGAVYVYTRMAGVWTEQQKLIASDSGSNEYFGASIALSEDENTLIITASGDSTSPNSYNGAAYIFTQTAGAWTEQAKILASDATSFSYFGESASISSDGNTVIVGAYSASTSPSAQEGAAYVFTRSAGVWTQQQKLIASDRATNDYFGIAVALSADGNTAAVGASNEDTSPYSNNGAAYIFTRTEGVWTQQQKLTASDLTDSVFFGKVALSSDGNTALIGAYASSSFGASAHGAAYVFTRTAGVWTQQQKLLASDRAGSDYFGITVGLSSDGNTAIIGAFNESTSPTANNGAAYIFTRSGSTWTQKIKLIASDRASSDSFASSVSISAYGNIVLVGARNEDTSPNTDNGAAYIYNFTNTGTRYTYNSTDNRWEVNTSVPKKAPTTHLFTSSVASWTIPTGAKAIHALCIAGGGGGGGGGDDTPGGAGGGGGGVSIHTYNLITGYNATAVITVGAGGAGGSGGGTNFLAEYVLGTAGATGGTSSFRLATSGTLGTLTASGGNGGATAPSSASTTATSGGAGGLGMWSGGAGGAGGSGLTSTTNNGVSATASTTGFSPGGGGGGGGTYNLTNTGNGGAGASALTLGVAVGEAISKTDANLGTLGSNGPSQFVNAFYPAKPYVPRLSPGGGGNGAPSGGWMVTPSGAVGYYGGTGGLYGGGGGGGGTTPSGSGDEAFGGNGGAGAQGCVFLTVWYE
jgi:hypothetical protein